MPGRVEFKTLWVVLAIAKSNDIPRRRLFF